MPNRSNDGGLQDRMSRLEDKLDAHSTNLVAAQTNIGNHSNLIEKLNTALEEQRTLVLRKTSASRTVTWKQLIGLTAVVVFVTTPIVSILVTAVNAWFLPQRIESVVTTSDKLNVHFTKLINASLDDRFKSNNSTLTKTIEENTNKITEQISALKTAVKPTVTRKSVRRKFDHALARRKTSSNDLIEIQRLLTAVEMLKIPLERQDYKDASIRLYKQYVVETDPQRKNELLATFIKAANAKSISEPTLHAVPDAVIARAKKDGKYFEGTIDLSSRPNWQGAVFDKCTIIISKPDVGVVLTKVRFLECNFDAVTESPAIRDFLSTYLETTRPTVTFPGYRVQILRYSIGKPIASPIASPSPSPSPKSSR